MKTTLDDQEALAIVRSDPRVKAAEARLQKEATEYEIRIRTLDEIDNLLVDRKKLEKRLPALTEKFETARKAYEVALDDLGFVKRSIEENLNQEGKLCTRLADLGDSELFGSLGRLDWGISVLRQEAQQTQDRIGRMKYDIYFGGFPPGRALEVTKLEEIGEQIKKVEAAANELRKLVGARIPPHELRAKVAALVDPLTPREDE